MNHPRRRSTAGNVLLSISLAMFGAAGTVSAQEPGSLTGEVLSGFDDVRIEAACDADGTSTLRFDVTGTAEGPYPGVFEASGTVTLGPHESFGFPYAGAVLTFEESFRINSADTEITGTKRLTVPVTDSNGACVDGVDFQEPNTGLFFTGFLNAASVAVEYEAVIRTPTATFTDQGSARTQFSEANYCVSTASETLGCAVGGFFNQEFLVPLPVSTPGKATGGGYILDPADNERISFGFNAQSTDRGLMGNCTVTDAGPARDVRVKCLTVTTYVQTATHATFLGEAEVDGVVTDYRIDVDDNAEPGKGRDTFKIVTGTGYSAGGILDGGNIQVHRAG